MTSSAAPVLFVVGPTAAGKSRLALALAQRFHGEIVNADSRQVYRHMDIGTAKPSPEERARVPHHLVDIVEPSESFDLASFLSLARRAVLDIWGQGRLPVVVGGTGQYIWALIEGWNVPRVPPDPDFRRAKQREAERHGPLFLHRELQRVDPQRAAGLDPRNVRRVIRALEVLRSAQHAPPGLGKQHTPMENALVLGLTLDRAELYRRIDARVDQMLAAGLLEEVGQLAARGYPMGRGPLASPGYRELGQHLAGEIGLEEAGRRTKSQTHRLARRQYTWFKLDDGRIKWLDAGAPDLDDQAARLVADFLSLSTSYGTIGPHQSGGPDDEIHEDAGRGQ